MDKEKKPLMGLRVINMGFSTEQPMIKVDRVWSWVNWGVKNTYPQHLLDIFHRCSVTHKQIINRKVKMVAGNGLEEPINPTQQYKDFIANKYGDMNITEMAVKMAFDLIIFNGISLNPHWNVDNSGLTRLCYIPFERVRQDKFNSEVDNGMPNYCWLSDNWSRRNESEPQKYVKFNSKWLNDKSQIYYYMSQDQGIKWYPDVEYSPALNWIDADWEISNYHNNAIKNGFHAGFLLNFATGIPTEDEMDRAYEDIENKFVGSNNANKFLLGWSNGSDGAPTLQPIPMNDSDTKYRELIEVIRNKILETHEVINPLLFGIPVPGTLGGRTELLESLSIYRAVYIDGKQRIIENILNEMAALSGVDITKEPIKLKTYVIDIPTVISTPALTIADLIALTSSIKSGQINNEMALTILTTIYDIDPDKANKLLKVQTQNNPIL